MGPSCPCRGPAPDAGRLRPAAMNGTSTASGAAKVPFAPPAVAQRDAHFPSEVPVERRFSQASTTRAAMPASAAFRYERGS